MTKPTPADARRNRESLLVAARETFAEQGTEASLREVARRAGVGIGTLYRHYPTRAALLEALLDSNFGALRDRAAELLDVPELTPHEALSLWLNELTTGVRTYLGLPESIMAALADEESALHVSCVEMRASGGRLLERAQAAGRVRADVTVYEVIALALGLAWAAQQPGGSADLVDRLLSTAIHGLAIPG